MKPGEPVTPDQVVAQAMLPGVLQTIKLAERMSVEAKDVPGLFQLKPGDPVAKGQVIAESKGIFGRFFRTTATSEYDGTIESVSEVTGNVLVREPAIPVDVRAYIEGAVAEVLPGEGAIVETRAAMVQGIFGIGGERNGTIRIAVQDPSEILDESHIRGDDRGKILIGGAGVTFEAIQKASESGVIGLVAGGVKDSDLVRFLGYDIGVAITGSEAISLTLLVTEGFGFLAMAARTFELLKRLEGRSASINGATQIRAGVIRPELIVPHREAAEAPLAGGGVYRLEVGTPIRVIREPYFGRLGAVSALPATLQVLESGTEVRVLRAVLEGGEEVTVPRANVEIIASG